MNQTETRTQVEVEVERRMEQIRQDPEKRNRYDYNDDGIVDEQEWAEVRKIVRAEVETERRRAEQPAEPKPESGVLVERFELEREIGRGGQGITHLARDRESGARVAVKELDVGDALDWKAVELFEREGEALAALDHPAIPSYVDAFHVEEQEGLRLFLVQEYVEGRSLATLIEDGYRSNEDDARSFLDALLEIVHYIHSQQPPVVHRDIKPSNLIKRTDGRLSLVDFGAAQLVLSDESGGSTVVGTSGYMPLEQLMGRAVPATDLYGVGATAVHLLSHRHPADMPVKQMRLQFEDYINVSDELVAFLRTLLEPHVEDRFQSAVEAVQALRATDPSQSPQQQQAAQSSQTSVPLQHAPDDGGAEMGGLAGMATNLAETAMKMAGPDMDWAQKFYDREPIDFPAWTDIEKKEEGNELEIIVPANSTARAKYYGGLAMGILFALMGAGIPIAIMVSEPSKFLLGLIFLAAFGGSGAAIAYYSAKSPLRTELRFDPASLVVDQQQVIGHSEETYPLELITGVDIGWTKRKKNKRTYYTYHVVLDAGADSLEVGEYLGNGELLWIATRTREYLEQHR